MTKPQPRAIPAQPTEPWVLWRYYQGQRSEAGGFPTHAEAERARVRLSRAMPRFQFMVEYLGKSHYAEGM